MTDPLHDALVALAPRERDVVTRIALEGLTPEAFATLYGLDEGGAVQLAWRSFAALSAGGVDDETSLGRFCDEWRYAPGAQAGPLSALRAGRVAAAQRLKAAQLARASSRWRVDEEGLRWVAIVAILGLSGWFWWRDRERPVPQSRSAPR
jgi:hypothetical protein